MEVSQVRNLLREQNLINMESREKILFNKLNRNHKREAIYLIADKLNKSRITVRQLWIYNDNIPEVHKRVVNGVLNRLLKKQKKEETTLAKV